MAKSEAMGNGQALEIGPRLSEGDEQSRRVGFKSESLSLLPFLASEGLLDSRGRTFPQDFANRLLMPIDEHDIIDPDLSLPGAAVSLCRFERED
jgi:hypothetical protein